MVTGGDNVQLNTTRVFTCNDDCWYKDECKAIFRTRDACHHCRSEYKLFNFFGGKCYCSGTCEDTSIPEIGKYNHEKCTGWTRGTRGVSDKMPSDC